MAQELQSAQQMFEAGQNDQALQAIAQQRQRGEAGPAETYLAGQILLKGNQNDNARSEFESLAQEGDHVWRLIGESAIAVLDNNNERALETATEAANMSPGQFEAQYQLGYVKARLGDWAGSVEALERAIQINPTFAYAYYNAGQAYSRINRVDLTAERFERFLKLAPGAPERAAVESLMRTLRGR
jgi:tetratricopeptide (TPR) repeat protein